MGELFSCCCVCELVVIAVSCGLNRSKMMLKRPRVRCYVLFGRKVECDGWLVCYDKMALRALLSSNGW